MKSNTLLRAEFEIDILLKSLPDPENPPIIKEFIPEILALVDKFGKSGQSGGSAPYVAAAISQAVKNLCLQNPICPIMGGPDEFSNVGPMGQNKRCGAIFKGDGDKDYYLDAITWKTQTGSTWSGALTMPDGRLLLSRAYIKSYPFTPKTFVIDVIEKEVAKDDWELTIKDESQLKEVFEYYDPFYKSDK